MKDSNGNIIATVQNNPSQLSGVKGLPFTRREFLEVTGAVTAIVGLAAFASRVPFGLTDIADAQQQTTPQNSDTWVSTMCTLCNANDAIRVHVVNGVAVNIEGDPKDTLSSNGKLCAKAVAGDWIAYDPYRLKVPLKRVGPEGGCFDPAVGRDFLGRGIQHNR